ncbi:MAG: hypothetical protein UY41_C0044G0008 [Candidatus Moranbacteria bacterium GW2011_GWE1_49_15]|nr:MAG: hypothetical protein UX75_C0024G0009 [Candidatus Moranbacteria bacterium GW2011_GWE2_47_10]KKW05652.1 MAG: hypothetical protein UY41_C0044G0008 [Candidatus Moranbacteria bacterium GW2011_GWE1_49_15]
MPVSASQITAENVIDLINSEREKAGLVLLAQNEDLAKAAQEKAQDMLSKDYFAHTSPEGLTPWHWIGKAGYDYKFAGENLAINFKSAEKQNEALMGSATHRKNILGEQFNEIGVAVVSGTVNGKETIITVQQFGNRGVVVAAPEKKVAQKEEAAPLENGKAILIDSSLAAGKGNFIANAGNRVSVFKNEIDSFLRKAGSVLEKSASWKKDVMISLSFLFLGIGVLEILKRFHKIDFALKNKSRALQTISMKEYERIFRKLPAKMEKMRIIYLHQMKQKE